MTKQPNFTKDRDSGPGFTPGPWVVELNKEWNRLEVLPEDSPRNAYTIDSICEVYFKDMPNARLISAAPELYEACKKCLDALEMAKEAQVKILGEARTATQVSLHQSFLGQYESLIIPLKKALAKAEGK